MRSIRIVVLCLLLSCIASAAFAQNGTALEFDGNDHVVVSDPIDLRGPFTIEAWLRPDVFDGGRILSNRSGGGYELDLVSDGRLRFTTNSSVRASTPLIGYQGLWVHVAVTWAGTDGGAIVMYVNGEAVAQSASTTPILDPAGEFRLGGQPSGSYPFTGALDEVRIFSVVLDPETIAVWHTRVIGAGHPYYDDLEAAWSFGEGSGQTAACSGPVSGRDGVLGDDPADDAADPAWIGSGIIANEVMSLGRVKALYR